MTNFYIMKSFRNHVLASLAGALLGCYGMLAQDNACAGPEIETECHADSVETRRREPWMMGVKTNLLTDVVLLPVLGAEIQIAPHFSFEISGTFTRKNIFFPDKDTNVYGLSPEVRYWMNSALRKGHFFGLHVNTLWYTTKWADGCLYQNISNSRPAWSVGATYGYNLRLDRKDHWGLELFLGVGYGQYTQDVGVWNEEHQKWYSKGVGNEQYIGVTKIGVSLNYRFSVSR